MPAPRAGRGPATDFTVLSSLVGGVLIWLVLASYALGRSQRLAVRHLQEDAASYVAGVLNAELTGRPIETGPAAAAMAPAAASALASNPSLAALSQRMGLALSSDTRDERTSLASLSSAPGVRIVQATETPGMTMAPGRPELLQGFVILALAATCGLGAVLLFRLQRQHEATNARTNFVRVVSHELRTPLAQILMFAETLRLGRTRSESDRVFALDVILQETRRLSRLVENVLRFTKLEHGGTTLRQEVVDVSAIVRETATQFTPPGVADSGQILVHGHAPCNALGDRDALRQVLVNLFDNALKHGAGAGAVRAAVVHVGSRVEIHVEDDGPGICAADRERIWHAFERGSTSTSGDAGTGLGLTIVRALTEAMDGSVRLEPPLAVGPDAPRHTRFVVTLPARDPATPLPEARRHAAA